VALVKLTNSCGSFEDEVSQHLNLDDIGQSAFACTWAYVKAAASFVCPAQVCCYLHKKLSSPLWYPDLVCSGCTRSFLPPFIGLDEGKVK
jgi:hypothetical protein